MFGPKMTLMHNPVIGLYKQVIGVLPIILGFMGALVVLTELYLTVPTTVAQGFIDYAADIIGT
ncbi:hypothetical protein Metho_2487 (plasmid) [Methanomethylovorans hollandica DSM 15978]|jgi:hypothetical protein|uniref:Uncharacterized protein n=1 Tax=Methanomethylovorans hollandica (strain DSM 15978 / NBRC 107637 / DMS1) TaxID=867904 RepID=L0KYT7_METHD|nr:hypothetical protein [Methanomethylovorans hollandica]AGB50627.1 hypothetical protein Metho_2487 [Methanomethylovorans hollandica DSM 15978]